MPFYGEYPFERVVNVHWRKKKKDEPPPDDTDDYCLGGTWEYVQTPSSNVLTIHDALTVERNGIPGDRVFSSPPPYFNFWRVYPNVVEFGPITGDVTLTPKFLYGTGLSRPGSVLLMEGTSTPGSPGGPPPYPPSPFWPGGWLPKYTGGTPSTPTLSFSSMEHYNSMPIYPSEPFMDIAGSWSYAFNLVGPTPSSYPHFDPDDVGAPGVFYLTSRGGSPAGFSGEYQAWWDWAYGGDGTIDNWPGYYGDQFYDNVGGTPGSFSLKFTQMCGPLSPHGG